MGLRAFYLILLSLCLDLGNTGSLMLKAAESWILISESFDSHDPYLFHLKLVFALSRNSCKWDHTCRVCMLMSTYSSLYNIFEFYPCYWVYQIFIPFYCWVGFHRIDISKFLYHSHNNGYLGCFQFELLRIKLLWAFDKCFCRHILFKIFLGQTPKRGYLMESKGEGCLIL